MKKINNFLNKYKDKLLIELINNSNVYNKPNNFYINYTANIIICFLGILLFIIHLISLPILLILLPFYIIYVNKRKKEVSKILQKYADRYEKHVGPLYFDKTQREDMNSYSVNLTSFLVYSFFYLNGERDTIGLTSSNIPYVQCLKRKRRSLGDIYLICKYYYPNTNIEDVLRILIRMLVDKRIKASYCTNIHKYVFHNELADSVWVKNTGTDIGDINFKELLEIYENT